MRKALQTILLAVTLGFWMLQSAQPAFATAPPTYVFSTFTGDHANEMLLRICTSTDGTNFTVYADTGYGGPTGSLRDPSIMKYNGRYYVVFTAPPYNQPYANQDFVGLAWSTNLVDWHTMPSIYTTNIPGVKLSWAPEWVVGDHGLPEFTVNCSSASSDLRPYLYTATSSGLTNWSGPVDIGIGSMHLDTQVLKVGNVWHCFTKSNFLQQATATSITGPWTWLPNNTNWANLEGPCAVRLSNGSWIMYVDPMYDLFQYLTSPDLTNWSALNYLPGAGTIVNGRITKNFKHGTVIRDNAFNLPPAGLRATPGHSSVNLQWNAFNGASTYNLKRSLADGGPYTLVANVTGTSFTDSDVTNNGTYYYVLSMNYGGSESPDSAQVSATVVSNTASLVHRYSFSESSGTNVADSVGGSAWNGTLPNGGTFGGGQLALSAAGSQYVQLPAGILSNYTAVTIEAWVTFPSQLPNNCFLFGFGNSSGGSGNSYIFCQPKQGRIAITPSNYSGEQNTAPNPSGNWSLMVNLHVTAVFDPPQGSLSLYTNGVLVAQNTSVTIPLSSVNDLFSYIGRSLYNDPYIDVNLDEFRIYNGALEADDIAASDALGPNQVLPSIPPDAPTGLTATPENTRVVLRWNAATNATGYNVKRALTSGGPYSLIATNTGALTWTDTGLTNGAMYFYVVSATNYLGESTNSIEASAQPIPSNNSSWGDQGDNTYKNPTIPGDYSDQDVIRVGDTYYMISSTMQLSPGMAVLQSKDLVNWQSISHVVTDLDQIGPELDYSAMNAYGRGVWAGSLRYYNGKFWCYFSAPDHGYFLSTATNAAGPWSPLTRVTYDNDTNSPGAGWDDCCSFQDDDGTLYFVGTCFSAAYATHLWQMSPDGTKLISATDTVIYTGSGAEANKIYKINGYYYIYHSKVTSGRNAFMLRATNIWGNGGSPGHVGTYEEHQLYQTAGNDREPNQGGLVQKPDGAWYFPTHQGSMGVEGRPACLLPVTWTNNWPVIGVDANGSGIGGMVWSGTKPAIGFPVVLPQGSDEFNSTNLDPQWQWNYQPRSNYWSLSVRPGYLRLSAFPPLRPGNFFKAGDTICQRYLKSEWARADVKMDIANLADGEEAGLAVFDGGGTYRTIGVVQSGAARSLKFNDNGTVTIGPAVTNTTIYFRTQVDGSSTARFSYSYDGINFSPLGGSFALTSANYRGSEIGIYNYNNTTASGYVDVDWFHYNYAGPVLPPFATAPTPEDGANGLGNQLTLSWQAGAGATAHQVYFGTNPVPGSLEYQGQQTATNFTPASLAPGTTYYWRVDEVNSNGIAPGNVWSFTTWSTNVVSGLIAYWPFDASSGTMAVDASGNTNTTTLVGGTSWAPGVLSNAVSLDGSSGYVNCPTNLLNGLTNFTITAWVKPASVSTWARIFDFGSSTKSYMFLAPQSGGGTFRFAITTNYNNNEQQINGAAPLPANVWTHVAVTLSGGVGTLYTNGVVVGVNNNITSNPASLGNTTTNQLGKSKFNDPYFNGLIDEFRIYNRALTASEISTLIYLPTTPTGLKAVAGDGQITLTWSGADYASGYNVKMSTAAGGPYTVLATNLANTTFTCSGLTNGAMYFFVVSAANALGESADSAQAGARPVSTTSPKINVGISGSQFQLNWPADHTGWRLQMNTNLGTTNWQAVSGADAGNFISIPPTNSNTFFRMIYP